MLYQSWIGAIVLAAALCMATTGAQAFDDTKYPDWKGRWDRGGIPPRWVAAGQRAPLTPEYQALFEWNTADQKAGGHGLEPSWLCLPPGMPRIMNVFEPMELVITPDVTYVLLSHIHDNRRIYTDGRDWPKEIEPSFKRYSIGKWIDEDGDGRYDVLEVETRNLKNPRTFDPSGLPVHKDGGPVVKERFYLDKANPDILHDQITVEDHALTRPWTVLKTMRREKKPIWVESICAEGNIHVSIGNQHYLLNGDGELMPFMKDQPPPDLKHFSQPKK